MFTQLKKYKLIELESKLKYCNVAISIMYNINVANYYNN